MEYIINLNWDSEANVWVALSDDIQGLVLESGSIDALIERVKFSIPEILLLNKIQTNKKIFLCFKLERHEQVSA